MSWLDGLLEQAFQAYNTIQESGSSFAQRSKINFTSFVTVTDDSTNDRTNISFTPVGLGTVPPDPNTLVLRDNSGGGEFTSVSGAPGADGTPTVPADPGGILSLAGGVPGADGGAGGGAGGSVDIDATVGTGSEANGEVHIGITNADVIHIGRTGKTTFVDGAFRAVENSQFDGDLAIVGDLSSDDCHVGGNLTVIGTGQVTGTLQVDGAQAAFTQLAELSIDGDDFALLEVESVRTGLRVKADAGSKTLDLVGWNTQLSAANLLKIVDPGASDADVLTFPTQSTGTGFLTVAETLGGFTLRLATRAGTGAHNGGDVTIEAPDGQAQTGGANNNNGGNLVHIAGAKGTGGAGAAGIDGAHKFFVGQASPVGLFTLFKNANAVQFTADVGRDGFIFSANSATQYVVFEAGSQGIFFDASLLTLRDSGSNTAVTSAINGSGATSLTVGAGVTSFTISQSDNTTNNATGAKTTIKSQKCTGTTSTGGDLEFIAESGTSASGAFRVKCGSSTRIQCAAATTDIYDGAGLSAFSCDGSSNIVIGESAPTIALGDSGNTNNIDVRAATYVAIRCGAGSAPVVQAVEANGAVAALASLSVVTATQMPANTGDGVIYIANASTIPSASAVGGGILYVQGGALKYRGSSGTVTPLAPA